jgi:hypothetical protein
MQASRSVRMGRKVLDDKLIKGNDVGLPSPQLESKVEEIGSPQQDNTRPTNVLIGF